MGPVTKQLRLLALTTLSLAAARAQSMQGVEAAGGPFAASLNVSGNVELSTANEDKRLPPDLHLALDCHGVFYNGGGTSQNGQFRFTINPDPGEIAAANICTMEAKAFGFDSTSVRFPLRSSSGVVSAGTITITRNAGGDAEAQSGGRTGITVSATSLKAPPGAVKLLDHGVRFLQQRKFSDAAKDFQAAIKLYPDYAESWLNLGRARVSMDALAPAREAFLKAAELDPQMSGPPAELGLLAARQSDLPSAARYLDESLRLDPGNTFQTCYSDALVNLMLKRYDVAERSARAALRFGDTAAQARADYVLGMALLARGHNPEAKQRLNRYLELAPNAPEHDQVLKELSRLERLETAK